MQKTLQFDGPSLTDADHERLGKQLACIFAVISDGQWRTLRQLEEATGFTSSSISAQLRNLRKPRFGSHVVAREHVGGGLYRYRLEM